MREKRVVISIRIMATCIVAAVAKRLNVPTTNETFCEISFHSLASTSELRYNITAEDIASVGKTGVYLGKLKRRLDMRVYLDNCCYNRPYDNQSQLRISLESQAKLHVQGMIRDGEIQLASSYMLIYENSKNRSETKAGRLTCLLQIIPLFILTKHIAVK